MIERVYLDNIRTFVNFELQPGPLVLLAGANGAGKTALLQVLLAVKELLTGNNSTDEAFGDGSQTRWETRTDQTVELDARGPRGLFRYRLVIGRDGAEPRLPRVKQESLHHEGILLLHFSGGEVVLCGDDGGEAARFPARGNRSAVGMVEPARENTLLGWFKSWAAGMALLRPDPRAMVGRYLKRTASLAPDLSNFCAWYMEMLAAKPGTMFRVNGALGQVLDGFLELFDRAGHIFARFEQAGNTVEYSFEELSDGQRALISLYVVRHALAVPGRVVVVDEPDNYVALREIQPWLNEVMDLALRPGGPQLWLISHHPELMNVLAKDFGWRLFREGQGPTRLARFVLAPGLDAAETAARGWDDAQ